MRNKGYEPIVNELLMRLHFLSADGLDWTLRQHRSSYNSWALYIPGNSPIHLRAQRPLDGTLRLHSFGKQVGHWRYPSDVAAWFDTAIIRAQAHKARV